MSHDLSEIIQMYLTKETFLIIINVENNFAASYFVWKWRYTIFQDVLINRKNSIYLQLSNIITKTEMYFKNPI